MFLGRASLKNWANEFLSFSRSQEHLIITLWCVIRYVPLLAKHFLQAIGLLNHGSLEERGAFLYLLIQSRDME